MKKKTVVCYYYSEGGGQTMELRRITCRRIVELSEAGVICQGLEYTYFSPTTM